MFDSWDAATEAVRQIVQTKLWPANLRVLDPAEGHRAAGLDGSKALLIIGFESDALSQRHNIGETVEIARGCGGTIDDDEVRVSDGTAAPTGREGAVGAWVCSSTRTEK